MSRPGIDPRQWVSLAVVEEVHVSTSRGYLVDVMLLPSELHHTARVAPAYAGNGFGLYLPLEVDDEVLVVAPDGDPDAGLVVVCRLWSTADPVPATAAAVTTQTDLLLEAKSNATIRIRVAGTGNVVIDPQGTGKVKLGGETSLEPAVLGTTLQGFLGTGVAAPTALTLQSWLDTVHAYLLGLVVFPPGTIGPQAPTVTATKVEVK